MKVLGLQTVYVGELAKITEREHGLHVVAWASGKPTQRTNGWLPALLYRAPFVLESQTAKTL